jgi:hypothetical protein
MTTTTKPAPRPVERKEELDLEIAPAEATAFVRTGLVYNKA